MPTCLSWPGEARSASGVSDCYVVSATGERLLSPVAFNHSPRLLRVRHRWHARQVMVYTLGQMYRQGQISAGLAARLLGCDRWAFYNLLSEHGFPVIDYPPDEQDDEAQTSRELAEQVRQR